MNLKVPFYNVKFLLPLSTSCTRRYLNFIMQNVIYIFRCTQGPTVKSLLYVSTSLSRLVHSFLYGLRWFVHRTFQATDPPKSSQDRKLGMSIASPTPTTLYRMLELLLVLRRTIYNFIAIYTWIYLFYSKYNRTSCSTLICVGSVCVLLQNETKYLFAFLLIL